MNRLFERVAPLTMAVVVMAACTTANDPIPVSTIQLQPGLDSIILGDTYDNWIVTLRDLNGNTLTDRKLTWSSQHPEIASVDPVTGLVTGVATGSSTITLAVEGKQASADMRVIAPVLSIVVTPDSFDLPLTSTRLIQPLLVGPSGVAISGRQITYASSNSNIATVSTTGVVTPVSLGMATITVASSGQLTTVRVRVISEPVASVRITPPGSVHIIRLGQAKQLTAECLNASQQVLAGRTISWNSSNPLIASIGVSSGLVTGLAIGGANIQATCDNSVSNTVQAQVTLVPVSSVAISPSQLSLLVGQQNQLIATARDSANNLLSVADYPVLWTTENNPVATVNSQGVVSAVAAGMASIRVSVQSVLSPPIPVTVINVPVATVTISPLNPTVVCGNQVQLTAVTKDANGVQLNGRAVQWQSGSQSVATIGASTGIATGLVPGFSQITATSEGVSAFVLLNVTTPLVGTCP